MNYKLNISGKNIYPFSKENFDAIINYYFIENGIRSEGPDTLEIIYKDMSKIKLFEFEFIVNCLIENLSIFEENLSGLTISNLCKYGLDAFNGEPYSGSKNRNKITHLFREALENRCK